MLNISEILNNFIPTNLSIRRQLMSLANDKIVLQEADTEGVGDLVQRAQTRLIVDHDDNKMDKVPTAVNGNVAAFDANGQVVDSGQNLDIINYVDDGSFIPPSGTGDRSLAIGDDAQTDAAEEAVAIGTGARAESSDSIAIGRAFALGDRNIAIGNQARATGSIGTIAIGPLVQNSEDRSTMIGNDSDFNTLHLKDQGRFHLIGDNAAYNVPEYTVATVPTGNEGDLIYVTDGDAGSKCLAFHDGVAWKVISLGATISAT